jgi:hypothetical protein
LKCDFNVTCVLNRYGIIKKSCVRRKKARRGRRVFDFVWSVILWPAGPNVPAYIRDARSLPGEVTARPMLSRCRRKQTGKEAQQTNVVTPTAGGNIANGFCSSPATKSASCGLTVAARWSPSVLIILFRQLARMIRCSGIRTIIKLLVLFVTVSKDKER